MPRAPKCLCGTCHTCEHREYVRRQRAADRRMRDIIWLTEEPWATQAKRVARQLSAYVCPLAAAVKSARGVLDRARKTRAMAVGAIMESDGQEGGMQ